MQEIPLEAIAKFSDEDLLLEAYKRRLAKETLLGFAEYTHPTWQTNTHHETICEKLEAVARGDIERLMVHTPPRHSKSELASRRFPAWYLGQYPDRQIIITSYGDTLAQDLSRDVRNILRDTYYQRVFPATTIDKDTTAGGRWGTNQGGVVIAAGIGGQITGRGAHLAIIDDPIKDRADAESKRKRDNCWHWFHGVLRTRLMPGGTILLMMTRWHEDDLAGRLLDSEGDKWEVLNLPAIINEGDEGNETALWPDRYPIETLGGIRSDLSNAGRLREWKAQYQQNPTPEEGIFLKREWFESRYDKPPDYLNIYMSSDFAVTEASEARDPDFTCHGVFGLASDDKLYVLDWWRGRTNPDVWIDVLLDMIGRWKPMFWLGEAGQIRRSVEGIIKKKSLERRVYFETKWKPASKNKALKATALKAWASMGRIVFPKTPWAGEVIENCVGFPTLKHDDDFDTMALMCSCIDEILPAVERSIKPVRKKDVWQRWKSKPSMSWKVI